MCTWGLLWHIANGQCLENWIWIKWKGSQDQEWKRSGQRRLRGSSPMQAMGPIPLGSLSNPDYLWSSQVCRNQEEGAWMVQGQMGRSQQESSGVCRERESHSPQKPQSREACELSEVVKAAPISLTSASEGRIACLPPLLILLQPRHPAFTSLDRSSSFLPSRPLPIHCPLPGDLAFQISAQLSPSLHID